MSAQADRQRARRTQWSASEQRFLVLLEQARQGELLLAQVLNLLAQRDAVVDELELRAGRLLVELQALRWPGAKEHAAARGLSVHRAAQLRRRAQAELEPRRAAPAVPSLEDSPPALSAERLDGSDGE